MGVTPVLRWRWRVEDRETDAEQSGPAALIFPFHQCAGECYTWRLMENPRDNWALYKRLFVYVRPFRRRLIMGIVCSVLYGPANAAVLSVVQKAWAWAFESDWSHPWWEMVGIALLLPVAMMVRGALDFLGTYLLSWVGLRVVMDLRVRIFQHLESMSLDFFTG